jgi:hypothetical protein
MLPTFLSDKCGKNISGFALMIISFFVFIFFSVLEFFLYIFKAILKFVFLSNFINVFFIVIDFILNNP